MGSIKYVWMNCSTSVPQFIIVVALLMMLAWRNTCSSVAYNQPHEQPVYSALFAIRFFPRPCGRARHKCSAERARPDLDRKGTWCCNCCDHWLRSADGMAVHRSSIFAIRFSSC